MFLKAASDYCSEYGLDALSICEMMRKEKACCIVRVDDDSLESRFMVDVFMTDFNASAIKKRIMPSDSEQKIMMLLDGLDDFCISNLEDTWKTL